MTSANLLEQQAILAFSQLEDSVVGVGENKAWARLAGADEAEYLHTCGCIQSIVLHVASAKVMYGSIAFRDGEVRWRDCVQRISAIEPSWKAACEYLQEAQEYWLSCWKGLADERLSEPVRHFSGKKWAAWKIIHTVTDHDAYHAGQVALIRFSAGVSNLPPPSYADDIQEHCRDLPNW